MKTLTFTLLTFITITAFSQTVSPPSSCTAVIGSPANGVAHYIDIYWSPAESASGYEVQYSTDSITWLSLRTVGALTTSHNTGSSGNLPFYYRVRAQADTLTSTWTYASPSPIFSACNDPGAPVISNAGSHSLNLSVAVDNNSPVTRYSIYCVTDSLYVQGNGTLGTTEIYQTSSAWGTITATGLKANTNYCFYAKAKNNDGDTRIKQGESWLLFEPWTTSVLDTSAASPTNLWWSPDTAVSGPLQFYSSGNCSGGSVGFEGSNNHYFSSLLRSPVVNCTGLTQATMQFNISNSYFATHPNDHVAFSIWAPTAAFPNGTFIHALTVNDVTGFTLPFNTARSCSQATVVYDLSAVTDKLAILFFINPVCAYNDANLFEALISNISIGRGTLSDACAPTGAEPVETGIETTGPTVTEIYPNPFTGYFTIAMNTYFEKYTAQLYDETGRKIRQLEFPGNESLTVDAAGLTPGIYFLAIELNDKKLITKKLLKVE